jgi:hypothetical protein
VKFSTSAHKSALNTPICTALSAIPDRWAAARGWQEGVRDPAMWSGQRSSQGIPILGVPEGATDEFLDPVDALHPAVARTSSMLTTVSARTFCLLKFERRFRRLPCIGEVSACH